MNLENLKGACLFTQALLMAALSFYAITWAYASFANSGSDPTITKIMVEGHAVRLIGGSAAVHIEQRCLACQPPMDVEQRSKVR